MKKQLCVIAGAIAALGVLCQSADAAARRRSAPPPPPPQQAYIGPIPIGDPAVFWSSVIVGAGMLGTYYAIEDHRPLKVRGDGRHFNTGAYLLTTVGCMTLSPMIVDAAYAAYPEWPR